uniref:(northern house mosquito) hypothetical protein n=1 Tax=Culex pipiens TaxID=7175 RepID=A0A8D8BQG5_CULPI
MVPLIAPPGYLDNCGNSRANTCQRAPTWAALLPSGRGVGTRGRVHLSDPKPMRVRGRWRGGPRAYPPPSAPGLALVTLDNLGPIARPRGGDGSFECLPYQLSMVGPSPTMVTTGDGESGFDSGEGA